MMLPMAMAGPYAKRLDAVAPLSSVARVGWHRDQARRTRDGDGEPLPSNRHDKRQHTAGDRREQERVEREARSDQGPDRRHQLHVAGAGGAEHVTGQHQSETDQEPKAGGGERHAR